MRLIDKESLLNALAKQRAYEPKHRRTIMRSIQLVYEQPTVDAVPVVHGHWIIDGHHRICSVCDNYNCLTDKENDKIADDFCPKCGAKMG